MTSQERRPRATIPTVEPTTSVGACPVCGETRVVEVREYVVAGRTMRMHLAACLHTAEELKRARAARAEET